MGIPLVSLGIGGRSRANVTESGGLFPEIGQELGGICHICGQIGLLALCADHRNQTAIVGFFLMHAATVGIKPVGISVGAVANPLGLPHLGLTQTVQPKGGQTKCF
jgi:hypothetical protein